MWLYLGLFPEKDGVMELTVTRGQIVARGLMNRCPNCGGKTLFKDGTLFELNKACPRCGLKLEKDEGFFLGSMSLNYGVTVIVFLLPVLVLYLTGILSGLVAAIVAGVGAIAVPILFYRSSRSWWLMNYYIFLPQHLPANQGKLPPGDDENI
ncbi:MAG TPA: TFIIB-type zinc ribbon-containing protein [Opitutaceae bacterium]|nr:TFIIB-type zinc ribbon-containing protein [Opitutaceae bacterium]